MILIALGANLPSESGSPAETLLHAQKVLEQEGVSIVRSSRIWLSAPVPLSDQPWYHNAVIEVETSLSPLELLKKCHVIEGVLGRQRTVRNAPRVLDLDLIAYHDVVSEETALTIPHPRMHERAFVLMPMSEIVDETWQHPVLKTSLRELIDNLAPDQQAHSMEEDEKAKNE